MLESADSEIAILQHIAKLEEAIATANYSTNLQSKLQNNLKSIEESFLETQQKLSFLIERNPLAVISWNKAFEVIAWNPAAENIFGYSKHEAIGRDAAGLLVPETARKHFHQVMTALIKQEGGIHSSNENITKDGKIITCKWYNTPLTDVNGHVIGIVSMVEDITESRAMEVALSRSEARFRKLVTNVPGVIYQFRLEPDGTPSFPYISDACREIFNIEPEEVQGDGTLLISAVHSEDKQLFLESVAISAQTLQRWDWEGRMIARSGKIKWIRGISRPELQADGAIVWDGLLVDVSEQQAAINELKQTQVELTESKQFINSIIDTMPVAVFVKDAVDLRYVLWNQAAENLVGFAAEEILGKTDYDLLPKKEADLFTSRDREVIKNKTSLEILEEEIETNRGDKRVIHIKKTPILDAKNNPKYLLVLREDITERKAAEAALKKSFKEVADIKFALDQAAIVAITNNNGIIEYVNDKFCEISKYDRTEIIGKTHHLINSGYHPPTFFRDMWETIATGKVWTGEVKNHAKDGTLYWVNTTIVPFLDIQGKPQQYIAIGSDITVRKAAEAELEIALKKVERQSYIELEQAFKELQRTQSQLIQSEKMSSLGQLVAGVAHEINNPVNFIYGNLSHAQQYTHDLLNLLNLYRNQNPEPVPEIQEQAEAIDLEFLLEDLPKLHESMKIGATRIREIVSSLRTFSRLDEAEYKEADIHEGIDSTLMILEHRLGKSDRPQITVIKEYGEIPSIACYAGQLNQVFMNILANAIDALEESFVNSHLSFNRQPTICIRTEISASNQILIRITDNGAGMCESVLKRLFDPFYTTKPVGKGTGMGLSISYQIVTARHGGLLECTSKPGEGSEFVITLPRMEIRD